MIKQFFIHIQQGAAFLHIFRPDYLIGDHGYASYNVLNQRSPFDGVIAGIVEQQVCFELHEINRMLIYEFDKIGCIVFA